MTDNNAKRLATKQRIIDAAREVFATHSKDSTTMQDIADKAGLGRRTLYSHFNNKEDIYAAVVEGELNIIVEKLEAVVKPKISPRHKLELYIFTRFDAIKEAVFRNGSLQAEYFQNVMELEKVRLPIDMKEIRMLKQIIEEGVEEKVFKEISPQWGAMFALYALKGFEMPYLNAQVAERIREKRHVVMDILLNGFLRDDNGQK